MTVGWPGMIVGGVDDQNWHRQVTQVISVSQIDQIGRINFFKLQIGLHRCVALVEAIKMHI